MALNYDKTKELRICFKRSQLDIPPLTINNRPTEQVKSTRLLGVTLTADLKWQSHIDEITAKASQRLYFIILLNRAGVESHHLVNIYTSLIRSVVEYTCQVWHTSLTEQQTKQLESIQRRAVRIIFRNVSYAEVIITSRTLLYHMEFTTGSRPDYDFILLYNFLLFKYSNNFLLYV